MRDQHNGQPIVRGYPREERSMAVTPYQPTREISCGSTPTKQKGGLRMSAIRRRYDEGFKKDAVKLSYASSKSVIEVARDLGISDGMLYRWRQKYTPEGDKTRYATLEDENKALRLEVAELRMQADMLKKATAYFANLHK